MKIIKKIWLLLGPNEFTRTLAAGALFIAWWVFLIGGIIVSLSRDLPDLEKLKQYEPRLTTSILDRDGELLTELFTQRRMIVPLSRIPEHTTDAFLVTEDFRFNEHWGVDFVSVLRAAFIDIATLSVRQGASTITQQLARDLYLHKRRTFTRKIRETLTAIQIERNYSKDEILEMYLTQIYFGHGAYGIQAAAQRYFSVPASDLTIAQSALIAALPKAPSHYSPLNNPVKALSRRNLILRRMKSIGLISASQYHSALAETLSVMTENLQNPLGIAPYFTEMIRQQLSEEGKRLGFEYLEDGLTVKTTLIARLQELAEIAVTEHIEPFQTLYRQRYVKRSAEEIAVAMYDSSAVTPDGELTIPIDSLLSDSVRLETFFPRQAIVQVALVALDPESGDILAMIGGRDFENSKFNRAVQAIRQPGSVFKPFVYTAAIDNGYSTTFELLNQDVVLTMEDGKRWVPANYDHSHGGLTTLRESLRRSLNLVTVRLVQEVVPPRMVVNYAKQLGISTPVAAVDAVALGASGVFPIEITSAFAAFSAGGIYHKPRSILSIQDRFEDQIVDYPVNRHVAISAETSYIITDMLKTVINRGTGGSARWKWHFYKEAAGKTGTTNDFTDAWFVGFTPHIACGVWVGLDDPAQSLGAGQSGAVAALPIWAKFMKMAYDSLGADLGWEDTEFQMPSGVIRETICSETKLIATPYCPGKLEEVFRESIRPKSTCWKHRGRGL